MLDGIGGFEGRSLLATWVHRIVVTTALGQLRRNRREKGTISFNSMMPVFDDTGRRRPDATLVIPDERLSEAATATWIKDAVARLPADYRNVFLLRDVEGYSGAETAVALGLTDEAVRVRLQRARAALRALLTQSLADAKEGP